MAHPRPVSPTDATDRLVGQSSTIHALRSQIRHLAAFDSIGKADVPTVLLQGETGTGKGLVARIMHESGPRARGPFIEVNCAAIPETLLEAELFGFEAGAFSDAKRPKPGLFEAASEGTLFLDEIEVLPLALQAKLLTAVAEKRVRRLGAVAEHAVDVKLITATQVELSGQVTAGRFRADLYHRLAVVVLEVPPLRARGEDILVLAQHFLRRYAAAHGTSPKRLSGAAEAWLRSYSWPGNVRELSHLMERITLLSTEMVISPGTLARLRLSPTVAGTPASVTPAPSTGTPLDEAAQIRQALEQTKGNVVQAARLLGLSRSTLRYRMVRSGLGSPRGGAVPALRAARRDAMLPRQGSSQGGTPRAETPGPAPGWEQKLVVVLAIDLSFPMATGFAALPYEPRTVARRWEQAIGEKVQGFGGVLLQRAVSPLMVAFGLPQALEQLPQRAVHTALAIRQLVVEAQAAAGQEPIPEVRQALHLGTLLVEGQTHELAVQSPVAGETLSVAVRLLGHTGPGEVLVSPQLGRLVTGWCVLQARAGPAGGRQPDQIGAYSVEGLVTRRAPLAGLGARTLSPFVGRERELTLLRELLAQAEAGRGQVIGIVGEPGMGKSRLLYEFRQCLRGQRVTYLEGRCLSYGSAIPYLPVLDLLRDHCGITEVDSVEAVVEKVRFALQEVWMAPEEWAPYLLSLLGVQSETGRLAALPPETLKARTFETLRQFILHSSRQQPLILAIEDLQWIDQTSEAFLASLVEKMGGASLLLLATYRPEYRIPWLGKSYVTQLIVPPLGPQDSLRIVRVVFQTEQVPDHLARAILAKGEGNPFFLEEIAQTLVEQGGTELQLPPTVQGVLAARIDRLAVETKGLLQALAVLGRAFSWSLLRTVVDQPEGDLQRLLMHLQAAEFLYEQPSIPEPKYTFKHVLTQDVAYTSLSGERCRELHERAAQAIEALFADRLEEHYSALAYHYSRSGNTVKAVYYLQHAGQQAEQRSAYAEAISHLTRALQRNHAALALAPGLAHPFSLMYALNVVAWLHQFRREAALTQKWAEALLALCQEQGFALYRTVGSILRGWALAERGQATEGVAQMHEGLTTRRTVGANGTDTCYLAMLAEGYRHSGQLEAGLAALAEALGVVDQSGVRFYEAELYRLKGELLLAQAGKEHEVPEAEACFRQAIAVAGRQQAKWLELRAATSLSRLWQHQGKRDEARHLLAEIYGWFTEGFETPDLREAQALLAELA